MGVVHHETLPIRCVSRSSLHSDSGHANNGGSIVVSAAASTPSAVGTAVASPVPGNGSILAHASAEGHPLAAIMHKNKEETAQVTEEEDEEVE